MYSYMKISSSLWRTLFVCALTVITMLSLVPVSHPPVVADFDKVEHVVAYGGLAYLMLRGFDARYRLGLILLLIVYSGVIELLQGLSGYRYAEWADLVANAIGALAGWLVVRSATRES